MTQNALPHVRVWSTYTEKRDVGSAHAGGLENVIRMKFINNVRRGLVSIIDLSKEHIAGGFNVAVSFVEISYAAVCKKRVHQGVRCCVQLVTATTMTPNRK
jgi:hypothetical protein